MNIKNLSDVELVNLFKESYPNNAHVFQEIVNRHKDYLFSVAFYKLKNREDAEDATQEAFIRAYHSLPKFRGDAELKSWLTTIMNNVCLTILLTRKRNFWKYNVLSDGSVDIENIYASLYSEADEKDFWNKIGITLKSMMQLYRKVFIFKYFKDYSINSIAEKIKTTVAATKMKVKRAKDQFIKIFLRND